MKLRTVLPLALAALVGCGSTPSEAKPPNQDACAAFWRVVAPRTDASGVIPQSAALRLGVDFPVEALDQIEASSVDPVKGIASEWRAKIAAKDKGAAVSQFGAMLEACDETNPFKVWRTTTTG